jgi:hypothetical protein
LHLRIAFFVLFWLAIVPTRRAFGQQPEGPASLPAPSTTAPAPSAPPPVPSAPPPVPSAVPPSVPPASTGGYTTPSTSDYGASPTPPYPAPPAPSYSAAAPPTYIPPPSPPAFELRDHRYSDAHVDRVVFVPTAETHPEGTLYFSSYEVVLLQAGYALSDRTQVTLTSMPPLPKEKILPLDLTLKTVVARAPEFRVAALGSVSGIAGIEQGTVVLGRVGGVVQLCFERTCRSSVSVGSTVILAGPAILAENGTGLIVRATEHISLLLEVDASIPIGTVAAEYHGMAIAPGIRFSGEQLGFDIAIAHSLDVLEGPAFPFLAATYRIGVK